MLGDCLDAVRADSLCGVHHHGDSRFSGSQGRSGGAGAMRRGHVVPSSTQAVQGARECDIDQVNGIKKSLFISYGYVCEPLAANALRATRWPCGRVAPLFPVCYSCTVVLLRFSGIRCESGAVPPLSSLRPGRHATAMKPLPLAGGKAVVSGESQNTGPEQSRSFVARGCTGGSAIHHSRRGWRRFRRRPVPPHAVPPVAMTGSVGLVRARSQAFYAQEDSQARRPG